MRMPALGVVVQILLLRHHVGHRSRSQCGKLLAFQCGRSCGQDLCLGFSRQHKGGFLQKNGRPARALGPRETGGKVIRALGMPAKKTDTMAAQKARLLETEPGASATPNTLLVLSPGCKGALFKFAPEDSATCNYKPLAHHLGNGEEKPTSRE